jgi:hypothetical protein
MRDGLEVERGIGHQTVSESSARLVEIFKKTIEQVTKRRGSEEVSWEASVVSHQLFSSLLQCFNTGYYKGRFGSA